MNTLNYAYTFFVFLFTVLSVGLGIFSLWRNPRSKVVRSWFLMSMAVGIWSGNLLLLMLASFRGDPVKVILYAKLLHVGASFISVFFCHFVLGFFHQERKYKWVLVAGYILSAVFAILSLTDFIVVGAAPQAGFPLWLVAGRLYLLLVAYFWLYVFASIYFLYRGYRQSDGIIKKKALYLLVAAFIGFGGAGMNWFPQIIGIYPYGMFIAWLYPILITYGIFIDEIKIKIKF